MNSEDLKKSLWRSKVSVSDRFCNKCRLSIWTHLNVLRLKALLSIMIMTTRTPKINNNYQQMLWPKTPDILNLCKNLNRKKLCSYKKKKNSKRKHTRRSGFPKLDKLKLMPKTSIYSNYLLKWQRWKVSLMPLMQTLTLNFMKC